MLLPMGQKVRRLPFGIGRGLNLQIDFRHHSKLYLGLYEIELNRHLRRLCYPGATCFDIGGHIGYDALVMARLTGGDVYTFEADEVLCHIIRAAAAANPAYERRIRVVRALVAENADAEGNQMSLDRFIECQGIQAPDVIKIDVEGAEARVLAGAAKILEARRPNLIVETHSPSVEAECVDFLRSRSYAPTVVEARRLLPDYRPAQHNRWLVCAGSGSKTP